MVTNALPVEAYPAHYLAFLKQAALGRIEVKIPNVNPGKSRAWYAAQRINQLRSAMKKEGHPDYEMIAKASVKVRQDPNDPDHSILIGQPRDMDVSAAFEAAGIDAPQLHVDPLAGLEGPDRPKSLEDFPLPLEDK